MATITPGESSAGLAGSPRVAPRGLDAPNSRDRPDDTRDDSAVRCPPLSTDDGVVNKRWVWSAVRARRRASRSRVSRIAVSCRRSRVAYARSDRPRLGARLNFQPFHRLAEGSRASPSEPDQHDESLRRNRQRAKAPAPVRITPTSVAAAHGGRPRATRVRTSAGTRTATPASVTNTLPTTPRQTTRVGRDDRDFNRAKVSVWKVSSWTSVEMPLSNCLRGGLMDRGSVMMAGPRGRVHAYLLADSTTASSRLHLPQPDLSQALASASGRHGQRATRYHLTGERPLT